MYRHIYTYTYTDIVPQSALQDSSVNFIMKRANNDSHTSFFLSTVFFKQKLHSISILSTFASLD